MTNQGQPYEHSHKSSLSSRVSPFRRPESPASPSPLRQTTPSPSPTKSAATITTPSQLAQSSSPVLGDTHVTSLNYRPRYNVERNNQASTGKVINTSLQFGGSLSPRNTNDGSALSKLQAGQIRELREGFQILDRDSDGHVGKDDIADMLTQLGLSANSTDLSEFFPSSGPQTATLPAYLNSLANILSELSPASELLTAFSAFDEDDSGQVNLSELKNNLLHINSDPREAHLSEEEIDSVVNGFTGRRAFDKSMGGVLGRRGEIFKYQEFVASISGGLVHTGEGKRNVDSD
ncbi:unnamed protein product [Blumeria hordei]|uniref:EF-hand domain-containing protein n=1 Tax=Blumeria hordei TaxID=2867405 RepID=A0A383UW76_BLUHO|nr:unnamed protein product [Blumeria hordei]